MSTEDDLELRDLLVQTLEKNGTLSKLRAQLRASVFLALEEQEKVKNKSPLLNEAVQKLAGTEHGRLCMDLIAEFFKCLKMDCSETVFLPESGLNHPRSRENLASDLGISLTNDVAPSDRSQPLLYILLHKHRKQPGSSSSERDFTAQGDFHSREKVSNGVTSIDLGEKFKPATEVDDDFFNEMPPPPPSQTVLSSVTHRQKLSSKQSSDSDVFGPNSSFQAKTGSHTGLGPVEHSPAAAAVFGSSNNNSSFLGDLPELPKKTPINPPPSQSTVANTTEEKKQTGNMSSQRDMNFKKLLGESFDEISQQSAESDNSSKSSKSVSENKKPADFGQKNGSNPPKYSEKNQEKLSSSKYLFNQRNDSKNGQHSLDDDVSEEIVEDLEIDDLLNSARSPRQISF